jgi:hypothetical protein
VTPLSWLRRWWARTVVGPMPPAVDEAESQPPLRVPNGLAGVARCLDCGDGVKLHRPWVPGVTMMFPCRDCAGGRWHITRADGVEFFLTGRQPSHAESEQ